jgi:SAM-dependent methyltransferase
MRSADSVHFIARCLPRERLANGGLSILEVGALDPREGYRDIVGLCGGVNEYIGVDVVRGPGVDMVCAAEGLSEKFRPNSFDVIIATELLEHVQDWRRAVSDMKNVCRASGVMIITTRSRGFGYHGAPFDFWRYEISDVQAIFSDCRTIALEEDPGLPGVFAAFEKPGDFEETDLSGIDLFSVVSGRRASCVEPGDFIKARFFGVLLGSKARQMMYWILSYEKKDIGAKFRRQRDEADSLRKLLRPGDK